MTFSYRQDGFTLIEIVVVIALAALILYGVLAAASIAEQSSRDAQRRNAVAQVESALEQYALTHSNSYADSGNPNDFVDMVDLYGNCGGGSASSTQYLDCGVLAPGGSQYADGPQGGPTATNQISITDRSGTYTQNDGYCVRVKLEGGGGEIYGATDSNKSGRSMNGGCS